MKITRKSFEQFFINLTFKNGLKSIMLLKFVYITIVKHLYTLQHLFDPITTENDLNFMGQRMDSTSGQKLPVLKQSAFLWPVLIIPFSELVGVLGLELDAVGTIAWSSLSTSPNILMHQAMLEVVWQQMDIFFYLIINGCILSATSLYTAPLIDDAYRLVKVVALTGNGQYLLTKSDVVHLRRKIGSKSSASILKWRILIRHHFYLLLWVFLAVQYSYLYLMVYINGAFRWSVISFFYWVVVFPIAGFYVVFGKSSFVIILKI